MDDEMSCRKIHNRLRDRPIGNGEYRISEEQILEVAKIVRGKEDTLRTAVKYQMICEDLTKRLDTAVKYLQTKGMVRDFEQYLNQGGGDE